MTTQIAVRLQDSTVKLMDEIVASGAARSRASLVEEALQRELRRQLALRDLEILRSSPPDEDLEAFTDWASKHGEIDD